jgi:hypothetical protein
MKVKDWLLNFMSRRPLILRKQEVMSVSRGAAAVNRAVVNHLFSNLTSVMNDARILDKPSMYNFDKSVCVLNNRQSLKVVVEAESRKFVNYVCVLK